jgi:putative polyhydroxyalkanoate system protein
MAKLNLDIPHSLSVEEAHARLDRMTPKLQTDYGAECRWESDHRLLVSRKGLNATIDVEVSRVHVHMDLGFLLGPLAGRIREGISRQLSELLA